MLLFKNSPGRRFVTSRRPQSRSARRSQPAIVTSVSATAASLFKLCEEKTNMKSTSLSEGFMRNSMWYSYWVTTEIKIDVQFRVWTRLWSLYMYFLGLTTLCVSVNTVWVLRQRFHQQWCSGWPCLHVTFFFKKKVRYCYRRQRKVMLSRASVILFTIGLMATWSLLVFVMVRSVCILLKCFLVEHCVNGDRLNNVQNGWRPILSVIHWLYAKQ